MPRIPASEGRRAFLGSCLMVAGVAVVRGTPLGGIERLLGPGREVAGDPLRCAIFAPLLGESFRVHSEGGESQRIVLAAVTSQAGSPGLERFSLIFLGDAATPLPEATHRFSHAATGAFDLFVIPARVGGEPLYYRVVICRFT